MKRFAIQTIIILAITIAALYGTASVFARASDKFITDSFFSDYSESLIRIQNILKENYDEENEQQAFAKLPKNGFDNIIVLSNGGNILYSTQGLSGALFNMLSASAYDSFKDGKAFASPEKLLGEDVIIFFSGSDTEFNLRIAGTLSKESYSTKSKGYLFNTGLQIACFIIIIAIAFIIIMILYNHKQDDIQLTFPVKNYIVSIGKSGIIRYSNSAFKKDFTVKNLNNCVYGERKSIDYSAKQGEAIILKLNDKKGKAHFLTMSCLKILNGYKLVGNDATRIVEEYITLKEYGAFDKTTGLLKESEFQKAWADISNKGLQNNCLAALIRVGTKGYYEILLGENRVKKILNSYAKALKNLLQDYGDLYALENGEFLLLIDNIKKRNTFINNLHKIGQDINLPIKLEGELYKADSKMGVVIINSSNKDVSTENIIYNTKFALKHASQSSTDTSYVLHTDNFNESNLNFTEDGVIERMIENHEISVCFQPQYNIKEKRICGFEALCRLNGKKSKEISIKELVELADQYGGMLALNRFVEEKAMDFAKALEGYNIPISINISPAQIMQMGFAEDFLSLIDKYNISSNQINIEIVESTMVYSFNEVVEKLNILKNHGVGIHIDDFGVAYSSMLYLKKLPITALKIDKEFIDDITESEQAVALVKNIIELTEALKLECICEGIETEAQCKILEQLRCHIIQGYLLGGAVTREEAEKMIKEKDINGL